jgi:hypothetical protein
MQRRGGCFVEVVIGGTAYSGIYVVEGYGKYRTITVTATHYGSRAAHLGTCARRSRHAGSSANWSEQAAKPSDVDEAACFALA